ncbi:HpaII family restriction endonuclease [Flavobacterium sp. LC2016-12]|uniref:HpaII family restriction endonuclease n=1 Tax=Flavobacterium sp. LC2016-12 TaxID=2783794 RepID=UPI00188A90AF|nr:HpaII family restriction endonuclease [Flavobacterium sp. LC2016-12]MBF4464519.1 HpaII family restriction endonuclease [Flavobacterium sp. LC2016-12]
MKSGNIGEWSEIYVLFKLLSDKILVPGDENIQKIPNVFYPIIKILRTEKTGNFEYSILDDIVLISGKEEVLRIPIETFKEKAITLLNTVKGTKESGKGYENEEIEEFMHSINCVSIKAGSSVKTDITIVIHDKHTNQQPILGFSIKSQIGEAATLFNASQLSNFTFEVIDTEINDQEINEINSLFIKRGSKLLKDVKKRTKNIFEKNGTLLFKAIEKPIFSNNLILIDSLLPSILAKILVYYYSGKATLTTELINILEVENPLNFDKTNNHEFYRYKIKRFLTDVALGMLPSRVWSGIYDTTGGYLIVKEDGDILCYHLYNKNDFENYLLNNTKLETGGGNKHKFGDLYRKDGKLFFKLNLQIRFTK